MIALFSRKQVVFQSTAQIQPLYGLKSNYDFILILIPFVNWLLQFMFYQIKWDVEVRSYEYWHHTEHVIG
jgi:hypothetical protein